MTKRLGNKITTIPSGSKKPMNNREWAKGLGQYLDLSYRVIATVGVFGVSGYYADKYFETEPYLLIFGIIFGAFSGFFSMIWILYKMNNKADD